MRLVETCSCGASIELVWEEPKSSYGSPDLFRQSERTKSEISMFRKNHKTCRATASAPASEPKAT